MSEEIIKSLEEYGQITIVNDDAGSRIGILCVNEKGKPEWSWVSGPNLATTLTAITRTGS